jgi:hypothetical protein
VADQIRVRIYNVRFGDGILVTVPDKNPGDGSTTQRHILIDVGNALGTAGGDDTVFKPVVDDILAQLGGKPLDLYIMTHEHLDHVQGLYHAATKSFAAGQLKTRLDAQYAWLTASAAANYYTTHPDSKKQLDLLRSAYDRIVAHLDAAPESRKGFEGLLANNNPSSTQQCVDYLRNLAPANRTFYVSRGVATAGKHPFKEAKLEIWAPEEKTSDYYSTLMPMALAPGAAPGDASAGTGSGLEPPPGVDAGAFYDLVGARAAGFADNLLEIDKAANNTSVVLCLEWRGKRLLFPGDAELASWRMMQSKGVFKPVDFLKVAHHGSHNGTPDVGLLDLFLPKPASGAVKRQAAISTWTDTYSGIPDDTTNNRIKERAKLQTTLDDKTRLYYDVLI